VPNKGASWQRAQGREYRRTSGTGLEEDPFGQVSNKA
jgi:hypothetical protein